MRQYTTEEKARLKGLGQKYRESREAMRKERYQALPDAVKELVGEDASYGSLATTDGALCREMVAYLAAGQERRPSAFIEAHAPELFDGYLNPAHRRHFAHTVDHLHERAYTHGWQRRPMRSKAPEAVARGVLETIYRFKQKDPVPDDVCDYMEDRLADEELGAKLLMDGEDTCLDDLLAAEIDFGNARVVRAVADCLNGDGDVPMSRAVMLAVVKSHDKALHGTLGRLLLAARLEEGLRQAICETMDMGTPEAFLHLLGVIRENDLIRFSSVRRAAGTWLGLMDDATAKPDRVGDKALGLMEECLTDAGAREECLRSGDAMKVHVALWALGFLETRDMADRVSAIARAGTRQQVLAASLSLDALQDDVLETGAAKAVLERYATDGEVMAGYLPHLVPYVHALICRATEERFSPYDHASLLQNGQGQEKAYEDARQYCGLKPYFDDEADAEAVYSRLRELYGSFKGRKQAYSPSVFPWRRVTLTKGQAVIRMAYIASALRSVEKTDDVCSMLGDADVLERHDILPLLVAFPETDVQRKTLMAALCDKAEDTRTTAYKVACACRDALRAEECRQAEGLLKCKADDARMNLVQVLMWQDDEALLGSVRRLLADKAEERRTAGLDIVMNLANEEERRGLFEDCLVLVRGISEPTAKERILIDNVLGGDGRLHKEQATQPHASTEKYVPEMPDNAYSRECVRTFMRYFPDSEAGRVLYPDENCGPGVPAETEGGHCDSRQQAETDVRGLCALIKAHEKDEYKDFRSGETRVVGQDARMFVVTGEDGTIGPPLRGLWREWLETNVGTPERAVRMLVLLEAHAAATYQDPASVAAIDRLFGRGFAELPACDYDGHARQIASWWALRNVGDAEWDRLAVAAGLWYWKAIAPADACMTVPITQGGQTVRMPLLCDRQMALVLNRLSCTDTGTLETTFPVSWALSHMHALGSLQCRYVPWDTEPDRDHCYDLWAGPDARDVTMATYSGIMTVPQLRHYAFKDRRGKDMLRFLSDTTATYREKGIPDESHAGDAGYVFAHGWNWGEVPDKGVLDFVAGIHDEVSGGVLAAELSRGDTPTPYSGLVGEISRVYGVENFVAILAALGKDAPERRTAYYPSTDGKRGSLSHLLSVCVPCAWDDAAALGRQLEGKGITTRRLVEASLYAPAWIRVVGGYLGWEGYESGCHYFMAHTGDWLDDRRKAAIARFTPLSDEELCRGACDIAWFREAYAALGQERFDMIYDAAKYVTDGAKHARARKYADAMLGKLDVNETRAEVAQKRNKDLLMAYALIPLSGEADLRARYLFIQQFVKESRKFGAQRRASEAEAADMALRNLATNAGYADRTRLVLRMEAGIMDGDGDLFQDVETDGVHMRLAIDADGTPEVVVQKDGKVLKSVPARLRKDARALRLIEAKKRLIEQHGRARLMFEQAMEDGDSFTAGELRALSENPVTGAVIRTLVFQAVDGGAMGFLADGGLCDADGAVHGLGDDAVLVVAHPYAMYRAGTWAKFQTALFDAGTVQPFKQVFRELYVKTEEELDASESPRYAGNQIQPVRASACLRGRRWTADWDGLQKACHKAAVAVTLYATAEWFSPSDIEAPTVESVAFHDLRTGAPMKIMDVPDVTFSEAMRDVDLAVSVAHAGGVDPEASHSTIEMRAALLECALPLFRLGNVRVEGSHAHVAGKYGDYTVHLGSGVVHKLGGTMVNILPVHSQHRGRLFLPFADDDPKTAEVLSKVLLLAEDGKIKDPSILEQIRN